MWRGTAVVLLVALVSVSAGESTSLVLRKAVLREVKTTDVPKAVLDRYGGITSLLCTYSYTVRGNTWFKAALNRLSAVEVTYDKTTKKLSSCDIAFDRLDTNLGAVNTLQHAGAKGDIEVVTASDYKDKTGYVVFRGTMSFMNIGTDLDMLPSGMQKSLETSMEKLKSFFPKIKANDDNKEDQDLMKMMEKVQVHRGFLAAYVKIYKSVFATLGQWASMKKFDKLIIGGHSLGAALAMILGLHIASDSTLNNFFGGKFYVIGLGTPLLAHGQQFSELYAKYKIPVARIETEYDVITKIPPIYNAPGTKIVLPCPRLIKPLCHLPDTYTLEWNKKFGEGVCRKKAKTSLLEAVAAAAAGAGGGMAGRLQNKLSSWWKQ